MHTHIQIAHGLLEPAQFSAAAASAKRLSVAFSRFNSEIFDFVGNAKSERKNRSENYFLYSICFGRKCEMLSVQPLYAVAVWQCETPMNSTANVWHGLSKRILNYIVSIFVSGKNRRFSSLSKWTRSSSCKRVNFGENGSKWRQRPKWHTDAIRIKRWR